MMHEISDGLWAFDDGEEAAPTVDGLVYTYEEAGDIIETFVPGVWVGDQFHVTAVSWVDLDSILGMETYSKTETKHYFDFWFSEFTPFDPAAHHIPYQHLYGTGPDGERAAARAHFMPPNELLNQAYEDITLSDLEDELDDIGSDDEAP
jgi:hypothetical protein